MADPMSVCTNTDISLALLVNYPVCPFTDGTDETEPKMWPIARPSPAEPGRAGAHVGLAYLAGFLWARPGQVLGH